MRKARRPAGFSFFLWGESFDILNEKNLRYLQSLQEFMFLLQVLRITQILVL